jgi:hypothetical protein
LGIHASPVYYGEGSVDYGFDLRGTTAAVDEAEGGGCSLEVSPVSGWACA